MLLLLQLFLRCNVLLIGRLHLRAHFDLVAFQLFANWCEYGGFERSVTSIGIAKDYMAEADPEWTEEKLTDLVSLFAGD